MTTLRNLAARDGLPAYASGQSLVPRTGRLFRKDHTGLTDARRRPSPRAANLSAAAGWNKIPPDLPGSVTVAQQVLVLFV